FAEQVLRVLLLLARRSAGSPHESLDLVHGQLAILVGIHGLENPLMRRLKLLQRDGSIAVTVHHGKEHTHHHAAMLPPLPRPTSSAPHAPSSPQPAQPSTPLGTLPPIRPVPPAPPTIVIVIIFNDAALRLSRRRLGLLLPLRQNLRLLLENLRLLLRRRLLLCPRSDGATHQNESRGREHQNLLLHVRTPYKRGVPAQLRRTDIDPSLRPADTANDLAWTRLKTESERGKLRAEIATARDRDCGQLARACWFFPRRAHRRPGRTAWRQDEK